MCVYVCVLFAPEIKAQINLFPYHCKFNANTCRSSSCQWLRRLFPRKSSDWKLKPISDLHLFPGYSHKHNISATDAPFLTFKKPMKLQAAATYTETGGFLLHYK